MEIKDVNTRGGGVRRLQGGKNTTEKKKNTEMVSEMRNFRAPFRRAGTGCCCYQMAQLVGVVPQLR